MSSARRSPPSAPVSASSTPAGPRPTAASSGCKARSLEECWKPSFARHLIPKQTGLRRDLVLYMDYYNTDRAHTGRWTRGRTPESVIGKAKIWS